MDTDTIKVDLTIHDTTVIAWALIALREMSSLVPDSDPDGDVDAAISMVNYKLSYAIQDQKLS